MDAIIVEFIIYNDGSLLIRNARALSIFDFTLRKRLFIVFVIYLLASLLGFLKYLENTCLLYHFR